MQAHLCISFNFRVLCRNGVVKSSVDRVARLTSTHVSPSAETLQQQGLRTNKVVSEGKFSAAVINRCYGAFALSSFAMDLYGKRYQEKFFKEFDEYDDYIPRDDPILIDIVKEYPDRVSLRCSDLTIVHYPKKYEGFFRFSEYDGAEDGYINIDAYKLHAIKLIATSAENAGDKLLQINALLNDPCEDARMFDEEDRATYEAQKWP